MHIKGKALLRQQPKLGRSALKHWRLGGVTAEDLAETLSLRLNIPLIDLKRHEVQPQALELVPAKLARKHKIVPLDVIADALLLVMADPEDVQALKEVANHTRMKITRSMAIPDELWQIQRMSRH